MDFGDQVRAGRALLRWSAQDLADRANLGVATVQRVENEEDAASNAKSTLDAIKYAFFTAGVSFLDEDRDGGIGVRMQSGINIPKHPLDFWSAADQAGHHFEKPLFRPRAYTSFDSQFMIEKAVSYPSLCRVTFFYVPTKETRSKWLRRILLGAQERQTGYKHVLSCLVECSDHIVLLDRLVLSVVPGHSTRMEEATSAVTAALATGREIQYVDEALSDDTYNEEAAFVLKRIGECHRHVATEPSDILDIANGLDI